MAPRFFSNATSSSPANPFRKAYPQESTARYKNCGIHPHVNGSRIRATQGLRPDTSLDAYSTWGWVVERLSEGKLSYATDKLVALSAVASQIHQHIQSEYLAGLWRRHLAYQLLWRATPVPWLDQQARPSEYIAPTWSWASVTYSVKSACNVQFSDERDIVIKIMDVKVEFVTELNPFGQVKSGYLQIQGHLARGILSSCLNEFGDPYSNLVLKGTVGESIYSPYFLDNDGVGSEFEGGEVFVLPIRCVSSPELRYTDNTGQRKFVPETYGILLCRRSSSTYEYVRVGQFDYSGAVEDVQSACRQLASQVYGTGLEQEGWGRSQVITIV